MASKTVVVELITTKWKTKLNAKYKGLLGFIFLILFVILFDSFGLNLVTKLACQFTIGYGGNIMWLHHQYITPTCESNDNTNCETQLKIPKIIHQSYKSIHTLPPRWKDSKVLWQKHHPKTTGWQYMFWNDSVIDKFMHQHYKWFMPTYDSYPHYMQRIDAARYFILYHYGGIYSDLDISPNSNIESLLSSTDIMLVETPNIGITNQLFASTKQSDFLNYVIHTLYYYYNDDNGIATFIKLLPAHTQVLFSTGSTALWILYSAYYHNNGNDTIKILSPKQFGRYSLCERQHRKIKMLYRDKYFNNLTVPVEFISAPCNGKSVDVTYFIHSDGNSWHTKKSWYINFFLHCHLGSTLFLACVVIWIMYNMFKRKCKSKQCALWFRDHALWIIGCWFGT
eukprot:276332_1